MNPVLLLHGAIGAKDQLEPLKRTLSDIFDVHAINFAGHGGEPMPEGGFAIETFGQNVLDWMSANDMEQVNIFGYSMGGYVGLWLAKNHPTKVGKLFTLATKMEWTPEISTRETKMLNPAKITEKIPAFAAALAKRHAPQNWEDVLTETATMMVNMGNKNPVKHSDLSAIKTPTIIGIGDSDNMVSLAETRAAYEEVPNALLIVFTEMQHPIEKVNSSRLADELESFF